MWCSALFSINISIDIFILVMFIIASIIILLIAANSE